MTRDESLLDLVTRGLLHESVLPDRFQRPMLPNGQWEVVSVDQAKAWLQSNTDNQRPLKRSVVTKYKRDMENRRWSMAGDPIRIDVDGRLIDGQHRLTALVEVGEPQVFFVMRGLDPRVFPDIDNHAKRSGADPFIAGGLTHLLDGGKSHTSAGAYQVMLDPTGGKGRATNEELFAFAKRHAMAMTWTLAEFAKYPKARYVYIAPVIGAIARAYYHIPHNKLQCFVRALASGTATVVPDDNIALAFRNTLTDSAKRGSRNSNERSDIYLKTCNAILSYERGQTRTIFRAIAKDPFKLPELDDDVDLALKFSSAH